MSTNKEVRITFRNQPQIPAPQYEETTSDLVSDSIDQEAAAFSEQERPLFRAAVYRVLESAKELDLHALAEERAWSRLTPVLDAIAASPRRPLVMVDAMRMLLNTNSTPAATLARRHGIRPQTLNSAVHKLAERLGVEPHRHPKKKRRVAA